MRFTNIDDCKGRVENLLNGTSPVPGLSLILSYEQCLEYCGDKYGHYPIWSVVSALTDWVIPLFLLLGNITYSKSASRIFKVWRWNLGSVLNWISVVSHLLVNPLDFLWSLALKLDSGRELKRRIDDIDPNLQLMTSEEKKYLCGICYALEDFGNGEHVDTLLGPLEKGSDFEVREYWDAISPLLRSTARNIAGDRRHNKFHSVLAIIVYGKDVFVALIQAEFDESFPYHMPHTLALRQLYYWLFCAIILSAAAGGFADQWSSHAFLGQFLQDRMKNLREQARLAAEEEARVPIEEQRPFPYRNIKLEAIEPWNGGNYNWRYPKQGRHGNMTGRKWTLLLCAITAVAIPVAIAFIMSWFTPTIGLGDRGIMELSYCAMWLLNWIITVGASVHWHGDKLFKIYIWNALLSLGSLYVLFGAFQGWYNNCASWSGYYSRGPERAFLDLNLKQAIESHIFTFYLPITGVSLFIQLSLAGFIIWLNREVIAFTFWSDKENRACIESGEGAALLGNRRGIPNGEVNEEMELDDMTEQARATLMRNEHRLPSGPPEARSVPFEDHRS